MNCHKVLQGGDSSESCTMTDTELKKKKKTYSQQALQDCGASQFLSFVLIHCNSENFNLTFYSAKQQHTVLMNHCAYKS